VKTQRVIENFLHSREALNRKPKTIQWYKELLARFANSYPDLPTEPEDVEQFLAGLPHSKVTQHAYYRALKALYRFAKKRYDFANPFQKMDSFPNPQNELVLPTLEPREMMLMSNAAATLRDKALISAFIDSGGRTSELGTLRKQNIFDQHIKVYGKKGERLIPISEETRRLLITLASTNGKSEFVFVGLKGNPLTRFGVYKLVRRLMTKADIQGPKLGGHRLRHAFGKGYLVNGGDLRSLQQIMGHSNINTTQKYASLNLTDIIEKHHKFTPLRLVHAAAQESFFTSAALKEAEEILRANKEDNLVSVGVERTERKTNPGNADPVETPKPKKAGSRTSKWGETPLLPGMKVC
jgi:site-specific recombinase XerD